MQFLFDMTFEDGEVAVTIKPTAHSRVTVVLRNLYAKSNEEIDDLLETRMRGLTESERRFVRTFLVKARKWGAHRAERCVG